MIVQGWILLGATAIYVTLKTTDAFPQTDDTRPIIYGAIGFFASLLFAYQSLHVVRLDQGTEFTTQYPAVALFGVALAVVNAYVLFTGPLEVTRDLLTDQERGDLQ